ncbi:MAG: DoxX family protein [Tannerella sp.]|jgi:uncharacterized membrane protein YphA (DoxX/SURF4 family)|nr:DoxX family protein [Tannerella sp.]
MKVLRIISRVFIGLIFIFSGYVKVIDPVGSAIKFGEYFEAFHMNALAPASLPFGIMLAVVELVIGICMLFGIKVKLVSWATLAFMIFFTILTFVLAVFNPVSDCGCFGDAIKLTNWETFYKNLILLPFTIFIFIQRKQYKSYLQDKTEWILLAILVAFSTGIAVYSYRHLPLIDFMAYKVGSNIQEGRIVPEGAPEAVFDNTFIYEKDGKKEQFKIENLPDSTWTFVDAESILISEGYIPPTSDFSITDTNGDFVTDEILELPGYMVFIVSTDITDINRKEMAEINKLHEYSKAKDIHFMMLTSSAPDDIEAVLAGTGIDFYFTDATVLKSMIRSNLGVMLLQGATILKKWSNHDIPATDELEAIIKEDTNAVISGHNNREKRTTILLSLILLCILGTSFFLRKR